jgi:hypothetical protein
MTNILERIGNYTLSFVWGGILGVFITMIFTTTIMGCGL